MLVNILGLPYRGVNAPGRAPPVTDGTTGFQKRLTATAQWAPSLIANPGRHDIDRLPAFRGGAGGHARGDRGLGLGAARTQPGLVPLVAGGHRGRRPGLGGGDPCSAASAHRARRGRPEADVPGRSSAVARHRRRSGRPAGLQHQHGGHGAHRRAALGRAGCRRRVRARRVRAWPVRARRVRQQVPRRGRRRVGGAGRIRRRISRPARVPRRLLRAGRRWPVPGRVRRRAGRYRAGRTGGFPGGFGGRGFGGFGGRGFPGGGLGGNTQVGSALTRLLKTGAAGYTWTAATVGSESAAPLQLATGQPVLAIGGFNGTDPAPSLAEFEKLVAEHKIHYFVGQNQASFGRRVRRRVADHLVGRVPLHRPNRRRRHRLQPCQPGDRIPDRSRLGRVSES